MTEGGDDYPRPQIWSWLIADAPIDAPPSIMKMPSRSVLRFRLRAVPDGVGPPNFVTATTLRGLPRSMLEQIQKLQRDDDDGDVSALRDQGR